MTHQNAPRGPVTFEIQRDEQGKGFLEKLKDIILYPLHLFKLAYNTILLIRHREMRAPMAKSICPMRWLSSFPSPDASFQIACRSDILKAILKHPRKDPEKGLFNDIDNAGVWLPLLRDLYPAETVDANDFLMTCHQSYVAFYRQPIMKLLGPQNIKKYASELESIVTASADLLEQERQKGQVNAMSFSQVFTTHVISRLLLGHPGPLSTYQAISEAIDHLNKLAMKKTWHQPITEADRKSYAQALETLREAIATALTTKEKPCLGSLVETLQQDKLMTPLQIKATLLLMYFGGTETAASLINYLLWHLGQREDWQAKIFNEIEAKRETSATLFELAGKLESVEKVYCEGIRLFTPGYVLGRRAASDLLCTVRDADGTVLERERIAKGQGFLCAPTFAGRDPEEFEDPDTFNPDRFKTPPKTLSWLPFGDGPHACPGQWLAKAEVLLLITEMVKRFHIRSYPDQELPQKGYMTLKQDGIVFLELTRRGKDLKDIKDLKD